VEQGGLRLVAHSSDGDDAEVHGPPCTATAAPAIV
jgi:hypothetical protein